MSRTPSPQQTLAIEFVQTGKGNAIVESVAGSGKTTLLVWMCQALAGASAVFCAYNKAIAAEIGSRLKDAGVGPEVRAATFHSLGLSAWRKVAPNVRVDDKKVPNLMASMEVPLELRSFVEELVSLAKQSAVGVLSRPNDIGIWRAIVDHHELDEKLEGSKEDLVDEGCRHAFRVMRESVKLDHEVVNFDDMIFAPLIHNVRMAQYDWVLIDEAQDTNPSRRALARKMLRPGGRLIAVGDPHQAIYGFTGADNDSLDIIADEFNCVRLPLTVTYRCPKAVVDHARLWVSHITAHDSAPDGSVATITEGEFNQIVPQPTDAILCRNTKPLVELAFSLIRRRIPCHVEGREIGRGLMGLATKWRTVKQISDLRERLDDYLVTQTERFIAKGQEVKAAALEDKVTTLFVLMERLADDAPVAELSGIINSLFADTPAGEPSRNVTLSTVHKSKGREWERVYLYGRNRFMPSPFARQAWQMDQENNLCYVAVTRAKSELIEVMVTPATPEGK